MRVPVWLKLIGKSILQQIFVVPIAAAYYRAALKQPGTYNLVICSHIGDFLYTMGYAGAFCEKMQIQKLRIVTTEKFRELVKLYPRLNCTFHAVTERQLHMLCIANRYASGQQLFGSWKDNCIVEPAAGFVQGYWFAERFPQLGLKNCICCGALGLRMDSRFEAPLRPEVSGGVGQAEQKMPSGSAGQAEQKMPSGSAGQPGAKKVLLCPSARAVRDNGMQELFRDLSVRLSAAGCEVHVNVPKGQNIYPDAVPVSDSLEELYRNFGQYGVVIGVRSGVLDLAAYAGCSVIALYPPESTQEVFYDIRQSGREGQLLYQYRLTGNDAGDAGAVACLVTACAQKTCMFDEDLEDESLEIDL